MKIKPLHDRVVVKRLDELTKTSGGIIIPDTAKEKPSEGIVEAVGDGARTEDGKVIPMCVKVGDKVVCQVGRHRSQAERRRPGYYERVRHSGCR